VSSVTTFIEKWGPGGKSYKLGERAGAQAHFYELCGVLDVPPPDDPESYCFEKGFRAIATSRGFADVWKRGHFGWEYKAPKGDLDAALQQLVQYALPLENPPLLIVSDRLTIEIHTHFTGHPSVKTVVGLQELRDPVVRELLRSAFTDPYRFKPGTTVQQLTADVASTFALIADRLRARGVAPRRAAHFLTQCVFCFFADDAGLLPADVFKRLIQKKIAPKELRSSLIELFQKMQAGGSFGVDDIPWFNGGLFKEIDVPELVKEDVHALATAASENWRFIDAAIFGTLFERGLDPSKRAQLGAHYTDPETIMRLLEPAIRHPLLTEWASTREQIASLLSKRDYIRVRAKGISSKSPTLRDRYARLRTQANEAERDAKAIFSGFLHRLSAFRVLDPACGSGNFLYMALKCLKDIEHIINIEGEQLGLERQLSVTGPHNLLGIETNEFASELAKVTVWIGELQWLREHGYTVHETPILQPLDHIQTSDALIAPDGSAVIWPEATVIVGNPPFLGTKRQWKELGIEYSTHLREKYSKRVPAFADLVCYWFSNAHEALKSGRAVVAGLVATNSIRGGMNRAVLDAIAKDCEIFDAWDELPWVNDGAAVKVSLITFALKGHGQPVRLNNVAVSAINPDLTSGSDLSKAAVLPENGDCCFYTTVKGGPFECDPVLARQWLQQPNPNGLSNAQVLRRWANGLDIVRRPADNWLVDFGCNMVEAEAQLFEAPYHHVRENVRPLRLKSNRENYRKYWWLFAEPVPRMRAAVAGLRRQLVTVIVSKHRIFTWLDHRILPDHALAVIAREDDYTFGVLQSRFHRLWSLRLGTSLEDRPRYTPTTCFETYPFPAGLTPADTAGRGTETCEGVLLPAGLNMAIKARAKRVAVAANRLYELRERWLNPPEWTTRIPEIAPAGMSASPYPDRIVVRPDISDENAKALARRTMTNLYNEEPEWLRTAHENLDRAVAACYGWAYEPSLSDEQVLVALLRENKARTPMKQLALGEPVTATVF
jgi:hypothetical protein